MFKYFSLSFLGIISFLGNNLYIRVCVCHFMPKRGKYSHEKGVVDFLSELREQGWKTINLKGKSPDGIAVKDNKIVAVEILTKDKYSSGGYHKGGKKSDYFMFDDVFIRVIERDKYNDDSERVFQLARKQRTEEKIDEVWNKFEVNGGK